MEPRTLVSYSSLTPQGANPLGWFVGIPPMCIDRFVPAGHRPVTST